MKLLPTLLSLLPIAFAASALDAHTNLLKLSEAGNGIIKLDAQLFEQLTSPKRTWSASVQFTALDARRKCAPCAQFDPQWKSVAKAWRGVAPKERDQHFFATVEFDEAPTIFQKLGLNSAPVVFNYPPASGERKPKNGRVEPSKYDFADGFDAHPLSLVISKYTPTPIPYTLPLPYTKIFLFTSLIPLSLFLIYYLRPLLTNRWLWALLTVVLNTIMTAGFMFVRIRNAPWNGGAGGSWIAGGYQNQFGQEVQVVAFIYALLSLSILMLILAVPHQKSPARQRIQIYLWTGVIIIMYSVLVSLFRVKNKGYPFKLWL